MGRASRDEPLEVKFSVTIASDDASGSEGVPTPKGLSLSTPTVENPRSIRGKLKSSPKSSTNSSPRSGIKIMDPAECEVEHLRKDLGKCKSKIVELEAKVSEFKKLQSKYERLKREYWKLKDGK